MQRFTFISSRNWFFELIKSNFWATFSWNEQLLGNFCKFLGQLLRDIRATCVKAYSVGIFSCTPHNHFRTFQHYHIIYKPGKEQQLLESRKRRRKVLANIAIFNFPSARPRGVSADAFINLHLKILGYACADKMPLCLMFTETSGEGVSL